MPTFLGVPADVSACDMTSPHPVLWQQAIPQLLLSFNKYIYVKVFWTVLFTQQAPCLIH